MTSFDETLKMIGIGDEDRLKISSQAKITTFRRLKTMTKEDVNDVIGECGMARVVGSELMALRMLYTIWQKVPTEDRNEWSVFFNEKTWDEFMENYEPDYTIKDYIRDNVLFVSKDWDSSGDSKGSIKKDDESTKSGETKKMFTKITSSVSSSWKVDSRDIPKLPKSKSVQAGFSTWEQSFRVKMQRAKVGDLMEDDYNEPDEDKEDELRIHNEKDAYLKSCLVTATMETTAYCEVILSKSGREIWFDLLLAYHGDDYVKDEATTAAMEIAKLRFDKKCSLTGDKFVSEYKLCLIKMADNGTPFPEPLVKADFLSKVTHPGLRNWKLLMEENELITHNEMFTKFRKQTEKLGETTREDRGTGEPNHRAERRTTDSHDDDTEEERGEFEPPIENQGSVDPQTLNLDLFTELGGPNMVIDPTEELFSQIDPTDFIGYSFIKPDKRGIQTKTTVLEVDEEMGKVLIQYAHGQEEWVMPNIIQESLLSREDDGAGLWTFQKVIRHRVERNGKVEVELLWDNGETSWEPLNNVRKDDPITIAKYAHDNNLSNQRGWQWTRKITKNPKKYVRMLKLMAGQQRHLKKFKFGVEVPTTVRGAYILDKQNGDTKWGDAIKKEIDELMFYETFIVKDPGERVDPDEYTYVPMLMCFDCKFDGRRKARFVANGSRTDDPTDDIYSGVVGIESVRLAMFIAELNDLDICAADVSCAFLQSYCKEKIWTRAGEEFGPELEGRVLVMNKSIYGLKTASASYHEHLAHVLADLGFYPSWADSDLWMKDCGTHYEYIATWVDE